MQPQHPGYPQQYPQPPMQQPPKPGMSTFAKIMIAFGVFAAFGMVSCGACVMIGAKGASEAAKAVEQQKVVAEAANTKARESATPLALDKLLSEYKDNEVRADAQFKGSYYELEGTVGDIKKGIIGNDFYVTLGTGAMFEIPAVQCFPSSDQATAAMQLSKGSRVRLRGRVDGLMMNVLLKDCEIL